MYITSKHVIQERKHFFLSVKEKSKIFYFTLMYEGKHKITHQRNAADRANVHTNEL